jgi:hypothetical protein
VVEVGVWSEDFEAFDSFVSGVVEDKVMDLLGIFDIDRMFVSGFVVELCVHRRVLIMKAVWVFFERFLLLL